MSNRFRLGIVLRLREMAEETARIELSHAIMRVLSQHSRVGQAHADRVSRAASRYILKALKEAGKSSVPF